MFIMYFIVPSFSMLHAYAEKHFLVCAYNVEELGMGLRMRLHALHYTEICTDMP